MSTGLIHTILDSAYEKSKAKPKRKNNNLIFILPKIFGIIGWISVIPGLMVLIYGLIEYDKENFGSQLGIFGLFGGIGLILISLRRIMKVVISKQGITKTSMIGTKRFIDWKDIKLVKYKKGAQELLIKSHDTTIRCNLYLVGFYDLIEIIEKKTRIRKTDMNIPTEIITQHNNKYRSFGG